jgi:hypothetical protein
MLQIAPHRITTSKGLKTGFHPVWDKKDEKNPALMLTVGLQCPSWKRHERREEK